MKVGDLVRIVRYGSRYAPDGTIGVIIKKKENTEPFRRLDAVYYVHCADGHVARHANWCLELINEKR